MRVDEYLAAHESARVSNTIPVEAAREIERKMQEEIHNWQRAYQAEHALREIAKMHPPADCKPPNWRAGVYKSLDCRSRGEEGYAAVQTLHERTE